MKKTRFEIHIKKARKRWKAKKRRCSEKKENKVRSYHYYHKSKIVKKSCENCNSKERLELHHDVYDKDIIPLTLCSKCHTKLHRLCFGGSLDEMQKMSV